MSKSYVIVFAVGSLAVNPVPVLTAKPVFVAPAETVNAKAPFKAAAV